MTLKPQQMLVEERGLENQIKRLRDLIPTAIVGRQTKYFQEQIESITQNLEDIKYSIKSENNRILMHQFRANKERIAEENANIQRVDAQTRVK